MADREPQPISSLAKDLKAQLAGKFGLHFSSEKPNKHKISRQANFAIRETKDGKTEVELALDNETFVQILNREGIKAIGVPVLAGTIPRVTGILPYFFHLNEDSLLGLVRLRTNASLISEGFFRDVVLKSFVKERGLGINNSSELTKMSPEQLRGNEETFEDTVTGVKSTMINLDQRFLEDYLTAYPVRNYPKKL